MEERRDCCKTQRPKAPNPRCLPSHSRLFILPPSGVLATMAATAVAARSRALAQAVSSSLLRRSCLPASRRASCINRYAPPHPPYDAEYHSSHISFSRAHASCSYHRRRALVGVARCRLPLASGGLLSALPLHCAVASARLRSAIASESRSWCLVPQGTVLAYPVFVEGLAVVHRAFRMRGSGK